MHHHRDDTATEIAKRREEGHGSPTTEAIAGERSGCDIGVQYLEVQLDCLTAVALGEHVERSLQLSLLSIRERPMAQGRKLWRWSGFEATPTDDVTHGSAARDQQTACNNKGGVQSGTRMRHHPRRMRRGRWPEGRHAQASPPDRCGRRARTLNRCLLNTVATDMGRPPAVSRFTTTHDTTKRETPHDLRHTTTTFTHPRTPPHSQSASKQAPQQLEVCSSRC